MRKTPGLIAAAAGVLVILCAPTALLAQARPVTTQMASLAPGGIQGLVLDEAGAPVAGAVVSALGSSSAFAVTDRFGHFELRSLTPGPYLVRAHLAGYAAPRGQVVRVLPSTRSSSSISLRRVTALATTPSTPPIVPASLGPLPAADPVTTKSDDAPSTSSPGTSTVHDPNDMTWRLAHARRSILKDIDQAIIASNTSSGVNGFAPPRTFSHAVESSARVASNFFTDTPFFGQLNILTTSSFDTPQDLFAARAFLARSVANMLVGAPAGDADWTIRGAVTQGDIASWVLSGDYVTRTPGRHRYDVGMSYSTQRYDGGNLAALKSLTDGSRNVGVLRAFDTLALTPAVLVTYGARYARYDYLESSSLLSPRVGLTLVPAEHLRIHALVSRSALAPGAEEFVQPDTGIWLPPQRTFSALDDRLPLVAEQTTHVEAGLERDLGRGATVSVRGFHQHADDQLVTLFGVNQPGVPPASLGHYFVANSGAMDTTGYSAGLRAVVASRVRGSVEYTFARATFAPAENVAYLLMMSPSSVRVGDEGVHDVSASVEAVVPETSTRLMVLYRVSNGFAGRDLASRAGVDGRFDVQVRQSLPFLDFSTAKWEMLISVRNFFHDVTSDQSIYDELLVVHPPKRVVGGLTLRF
ncbi:MAG TPA: TonB-dependent receptor [Vicinamibacterales bacterium]|nr:TonB-dependent receptor [Vicinamibacterales bacterium]